MVRLAHRGRKREPAREYPQSETIAITVRE
jgi:hypothetical protein